MTPPLDRTFQAEKIHDSKHKLIDEFIQILGKMVKPRAGGYDVGAPIGQF